MPLCNFVEICDLTVVTGLTPVVFEALEHVMQADALIALTEFNAGNCTLLILLGILVFSVGRSDEPYESNIDNRTLVALVALVATTAEHVVIRARQATGVSYATSAAALLVFIGVRIRAIIYCKDT